MPAPRLRAAAGLTLVELMVVIALVAVLAMIAAPSFRALIVMQRVKGINAEIVTDLQFARGEAVRRNRPVDVSFGIGSSCYVIYPEVGEGICDCSRPAGSVCDAGLEEIKTVRIATSSGVSVTANLSAGEPLSFKASSAAVEPGDFQVTVRGDPAGWLRTQLSPAGRPSVCTPDGSVAGVPRC